MLIQDNGQIVNIYIFDYVQKRGRPCESDYGSPRKPKTKRIKRKEKKEKKVCSKIGYSMLVRKH